jgi:oligoendopeptidase F
MIPVFKPLTVAQRSYLPQDFTITTWEALAPYVQQLIDFQISTKEALNEWLLHVSELEAVISEDACWRQIKMTCNTQDPSLEEAYTYFVMEIEPPLKPLAFELQKKLDQTPFKKDLDKASYFPYLRGVANAIALYKEENIAIQAAINVLAQQYGATASKMTIHFRKRN